MKVAVFGAGATGAYLGLHLARSGVDTTLIARGPHLEAMRKNGVVVLAESGKLVAKPHCTDDPAEAGPQDYVIVTLKAHSGARAVEAMQPLLGPDTTVVTAQNGIPWWYFYRSGGAFDGRRLESVDPGEKQWDGIGPERAVGCVVYPATEIVEPGVVRHRSEDRLVVGEPSGERTIRVETLRAVLAQAGFRVRVRAVRDEIWVKLWGNVAFNPVSALTGATLDRIAGDPGTRAVARAMMSEAQEIGEALGVRFRIDLEKRIDGTAAVGAHRTSMLQDLTSGRPLEIDAVGTAVQELGQLTGVATPTIDVVLALLRLRAEEAATCAAAKDGTRFGKLGAAAADTTKAAASRVAKAVGGASRRTAEAAAWAYGWASPLPRLTARAASNAVKGVHSAGQGLLATGLAADMNQLLGQLAKGPPTVYDKAMDANYLETGVGGGLHRLFDGGHTLRGAFKAARDVPGEDGVVDRAMGMMLGLFRDGTTPAGLPFFTWDRDTYHRVADSLNARFGIPKRWFADLVTFDAAEVAAGLLGSAALVFRWSDGESRDFARIVGSTGLAAVCGANPILAVVFVAAAAKAFTEAGKTGAYQESVKGLAEGVAVTAAPIAVVPVVVAAGGPVSIALVASLLASLTATHLAKKADDAGWTDGLAKGVTESAARVGRLVEAAADEVKARLDSGTKDPFYARRGVRGRWRGPFRTAPTKV